MLKVLVNPNWDIPAQSFFLLNMLIEPWRINLSFPNEDLILAVETLFPLKSMEKFDSSNKPLQKKHGIKESLELMQEQFSIEHLSNSQEDTVVTSVVLPCTSLSHPLSQFP